ncbi:MAG: tyrosine-protein phosphatase [Acutalibacteraceae bacterium]
MLFIFLDIHSHILPAVDDGAKSLDESLEILNKMKADGITDVIATPHFYADSDNLEDFKARTQAAFNSLTAATEGKELPRIMLGSEVLYYRGIGSTKTVREFCLNGSSYLLLELTDRCITDSLFTDIYRLYNNLGITPIIAHLERYYKSTNYKKLLTFIKNEKILAQINASSFFIKGLSKTAEKLVKNGYINFIGTDAHSPDKRPPVMRDAMTYISERLGSKYASGFIRNSRILLEQIKESQDDQ